MLRSCLKTKRKILILHQAAIRSHPLDLLRCLFYLLCHSNACVRGHKCFIGANTYHQGLGVEISGLDSGWCTWTALPHFKQSWRRPRVPRCDPGGRLPLLGPRAAEPSPGHSSDTCHPLRFLKVSLSVFSWSKSSVKGKVSERVIRHHNTGANWAARPGFGSVWSDFLKKGFRISPEQEIKASVRRDSVFFPTYTFDDVSPGGLTVLVVKQESFL